GRRRRWFLIDFRGFRFGVRNEELSSPVPELSVRPVAVAEQGPSQIALVFPYGSVLFEVANGDFRVLLLHHLHEGFFNGLEVHADRTTEVNALTGYRSEVKQMANLGPKVIRFRYAAKHAHAIVRPVRRHVHVFPRNTKAVALVGCLKMKAERDALGVD